MTPRQLTGKPNLPTPPSTKKAFLPPLPESATQRFIDKAPTISKPEYSWDDPYLKNNPTLRRNRTFQLPDVLIHKLDYISEKTGVSRLKLVQTALEDMVEEKLHELGVE